MGFYLCFEKQSKKRDPCLLVWLWHKLDPPWQVDTSGTKMGEITNEDFGGLSNILTLIVAWQLKISSPMKQSMWLISFKDNFHILV